MLTDYSKVSPKVTGAAYETSRQVMEAGKRLQLAQAREEFQAMGDITCTVI
jgi:hypothetical protein